MESANSSATDQRCFKEENFCMCKELFEYFKDGQFCDVDLIADDGKKIPVHRVVLSSANSYFKALFTTDMKECGQPVVAIHEVDGDILQQLVEYCYNGEISIGDSNAERLTGAATMLQFNTVKDNCAEYFLGILSPSNCLGIQEIADLHNMPQLKETAHTLAIDRFMDVSKCDEFCQLTVHQLSTLLKSDELNVSAENGVLKTVLEWIKHDVDNRKQLIDNLLECIRFQYVKETFLLDDVYQRCIELNCPELMLSILARRSLRNESESPRSSNVQLSLVYVESGIKLDRCYSRGILWTESKTFELLMTSFAMIHCDGRLIFMGGRDAQDVITNTVKSIDLNSNEIVDLAPMLSSRLDASATILNSFIYVWGGSNTNSKTVCSVEKFDFQKNKWTEIAPMSVPRRYSTQVILSGYLFVIGGRNEQFVAIDSVEYLEPSNNKWMAAAPMCHRRETAAACVANGYIYVLGGDNLENVLQSIERYDRRTDSWTEMEFVLSVPRYWHSPGFADGDWIYLAGGAGEGEENDSDYKPIKTFEKFNVITGEVIKLMDLRKPASRCYLIEF